MKNSLLSYLLVTQKYKILNLGDYIQSIAARQFFDHIDTYLDRDFLNEVKEESNLILNGWYTHFPENWPPAPCINPLPIAMHFALGELGVKDAISKRESVDYLKAHEPIGARDIATRDFLLSLGINSYFSGCLTLTLQRDKRIPKEDFVLAIDVSSKILKKLHQLYPNKVVEITVMTSVLWHTNDSLFSLAEDLLILYSAAKAVVTTRLHVAMPCVALGTPVLLIDDAPDQGRFSGLNEFVTHCSEIEFLEYNILPQKLQKHFEIREKLIKKCEDFTGNKISPSFLIKSTFPSVDIAKYHLLSNFQHVRHFCEIKSNEALPLFKEDVLSFLLRILRRIKRRFQ